MSWLSQAFCWMLGRRLTRLRIATCRCAGEDPASGSTFWLLCVSGLDCPSVSLCACMCVCVSVSVSVSVYMIERRRCEARPHDEVFFSSNHSDARCGRKEWFDYLMSWLSSIPMDARTAADTTASSHLQACW